MLEIHAILPDAPAVNPEALASAAVNALMDAATEVEKEFLQTVETWNEKPEFKINAPDKWIREIFTESEVYGWVNNGTPPHEILPVRARALRFMTGGMTKTKPGALTSGPGAAGTGETFSRHVNHPGIQARDFDNTIYEEWSERLPDKIQAAIDAVP